MKKVVTNNCLDYLELLWYCLLLKGGVAMNTLEDLYYGNLFSYEKCANLDDEVKELLKMLNRNEGKLTVTLTEAQKETF